MEKYLQNAMTTYRNGDMIMLHPYGAGIVK